jgi:hypothetical protein
MSIKMDPIYRNADGTINFDYYRQEASVLRREAQRLMLEKLVSAITIAFTSATRFERKPFANRRAVRGV